MRTAPTRTRRWTTVALAGALITSVTTTPAAGGLLGGVLDPILDPILDPLDPVLDPILDPIIGEDGLLDLQVELDTPVDGLVHDVVAPLTDTIGSVLEPATAPLAPTDEASPPAMSPLAGLEVLDGVVEDVAVPTVVAPLGDAVAPLVSGASPALQPLGPVVNEVVDGAYLGLAELAAAAADGAAYQALVTTPAGTIARDGVVDVPTALDVTGDGVQDLTLEVRVITARPSLRVTRLPGAPSDLPVRVEAVLAPNGAAAPDRFAVGFDALGTTMPDVVRATLTDGGVGGDAVAVELHAVGAGPTLAVVGGQFTAGPEGPVDPSEVSVAFTPVPTDVTATVAGLAGADSVAVDLTTSEPTRVDAAFRSTAGAVTTELGATVDRVPGMLSVDVAQTGGAVAVDYAANGPVDTLTLHQAITEPGRERAVALTLEGVAAETASFQVDPQNVLGFHASAPIDALGLEVSDTAGVIDRATLLRARLVGLPTELALDLDEGTLGLTAVDGTLDLLEVLLTSGPDLLPPAGADGIVLRDTADAFVVGARLTGLRSVAATTGEDGLTASLDTLGGQPFLVDAVTGATAVAAHVDALPSQVTVALADDGTLDWQASAPTSLVELEVVDPAGVVGRATSLQARIEDLPTTLTLATADGGATLDASAPIGLVEILATTGPGLSLPDGEQGVAVRDTIADYALAARIGGVEAVTFTPDPAHLTLHTDAPRRITIDAQTQQTDGTSTTLLAELEDLPAVAAITLTDRPDGGMDLAYDGSAPIASVVAALAETRADGTTRDLALAVTDLPAAIELTASDTALGYAASAGITALAVDLVDTAGLAGRATRLALAAEDLPGAVTVALDGETPTLTVPTGAIGEVTLLLTDGDELTVADGVDGILVRDEAHRFVVAARLTGLRGVTLAPDATGLTLATLGGRTFTLDALLPAGDGGTTALVATLVDLPAEVGLTLADPAGPFGLEYAASDVLSLLTAEMVATTPGEPAVVTRLEAEDLPTAVSIALDDDGAVTYTASDRLPRLDVVLSDPAGVFGEATDATLHVEGLPTGLTVAFTADGAQLATAGGAVDLLELLLTSGPDEMLADGVEGLRLRDTAAGFVVAARVTGLHGLTFATTDDGADLALDTAGGATFLVDVLTEDDTAGTASAIAASLAPLPASVALSLTDTTAGDRSLDYTASAPMALLTATVALSDAAGTSTFTLEAEDLPTSLSLDLGAGGTIAYTGAAGLSRLALTGSDPAGIFAAATDLQAELTDLPAAATITLGDDGSVVLDALGGTLGSLEALATSGPGVPVGLADGVDGIALLDEPGRFGAYVRIRDLQGVTLTTAPIGLTLDTDGGATFVVDAVLRAGGALGDGLGDVEVEAALDPLPDRVTVGLADDGGAQVLTLDGTDRIDTVALSLVQADSGGGAPLAADLLIEDAATSLSLRIDVTGGVAYTASQSVPLLSVDAADADGLFDRADQLKLRLEGLPTALDLALSDAGAIMLDAHGGTLGLIEAQATTGPDERLPAAHDGVLLKDLADRLVVFARFTALKSADVSQNPLPAVELETGGGRPLEIGLYEAAPGKPSPIANQEYTTALLQPAPSSVDLELLPGEPGQLNIAYAASSTANALSFQTNSGDRWLTSASISNPVPTSFSACQAGDRGCVGGSGAANVGSLAFVANQHTTLDVFDCVRPLNSNCRRGGSPNQYIDVRQLRVRTLRFAGHAVNTPIDGNLYFDTDNHTLTGRIVYRESNDRRYTLQFNNGFRAQNRASTFQNYPAPRWLGGRISATGTITCSPFSFDVFVRVLGIGITLNAKALVGC